MVPLRLRNRWLNCLVLTINMTLFFYSYIKGENECADRPIDFGLTLSFSILALWIFLFDFLRMEYVKKSQICPTLDSLPFEKVMAPLFLYVLSLLFGILFYVMLHALLLV